MTTAAAPNQLPESLFSPEHEGQVSAPLTPEPSPEGAAPEVGTMENGLPQMPPEQLQQALAQQFQAVPIDEAPPAAAPVAQMPAEPVAQILAEPMAQMPMQQVSAESTPPTAAPAEEVAARQPAAINAEQALAEHVAAPEHVAAQMAGMEPAGGATAPEVAETVLAAMPHPDTYQQMPPASANADHVVPGLAPEAQSQLQPQARYVPSELAAAPAALPETAPAVPAAQPAAVAAPADHAQPADVAVGIPDALEALSQPIAHQTAAMDPAALTEPLAQVQPQELAPVEAALAQPLPVGAEGAQPAEAAIQQSELQQKYADAMVAQSAEQLAATPGAELPANPHADHTASTEAAVETVQLAPGAAGVALATEIPSITQLPPAAPEAEKPLVLGSELRQLSTVASETQKKGGLSGLFSKKQTVETRAAIAPSAPTPDRVSVLGADAGEKKKGFSLSGLFSRKKESDEVELPRPVLDERDAAPKAATLADLQAPAVVPDAASVDGLAPPAAEEAGPVREEIMLFIGKNAEAFEESWENHHKADGKLQVAWSTPGFLLSFMWLAYRKLHKLALGAFALVAGMTLVHGYAALAALFVVMVGIGLFGKSLYVRMVSKRVSDIMQSAGDPNIYVNNLRLQGGVSLPAALCLGVLILVVAATRVVPGLL